MQYFFSAYSSDIFASMAKRDQPTGVCSECYQWITDACPDADFEIPTGLRDGTSICWQITDKFGERWIGVGTVDSDGNISIPFAAFPAGIFNPHAGIFIFEILSLGDAPPALPVCEGIPITICERDYSCIAFSFVSSTFIPEAAPAE